MRRADSAGGCSRGGRSIPGASKKSSQTASAGRDAALPSRRIGDVRHAFGKRDVLGQADGLRAIRAEELVRVIARLRDEGYAERDIPLPHLSFNGSG